MVPSSAEARLFPQYARFPIVRVESNGFTVVHCGAPDFLIFRSSGGSKIMHDIMFIEVKRMGYHLTFEQEIWKDALIQSGCKYKVIRPETLGKPLP